MPELTVEVSLDSYRLAQGAARTEGFDSVDQVVDAALYVLFEEHEDLRLAAIAREFEQGRMTRGRARDLAGEGYGPREIREVLREHGVDPYRELDAEDFEQSRRAAKRMFGTADDADEAGDVDADDGSDGGDDPDT